MGSEKIHVKTASGFEWDFDKDAMDDQELLDALVDITKTNIYTPAINILLGEDGKKKLYEHLRGENNRVPASKVMLEMGEIFKQLKENKQIKN